jgi:CRP/FNR family transcriptional regulator, anaerobic regulatory protein
MDDVGATADRPRGRQDSRGGMPVLGAREPARRSLESLFAAQVAERYVPPRPICWEGEPARYVFHLLDGCVRVYRTMEDGRRAVLSFARPGALLCLPDCDTYLFTAEAVTPIRFTRCSRRLFNSHVAANPELRAQLDAEIYREVRGAQNQIIRLGRTAADERVAAFLLDLADGVAVPTTAPVEIMVPFGRLDIADHLGLTVETVSREISKLKRSGLISLRGPHRIILTQLGRLQKIAAGFGGQTGVAA